METHSLVILDVIKFTTDINFTVRSVNQSMGEEMKPHKEHKKCIGHIGLRTTWVSEKRY